MSYQIKKVNNAICYDTFKNKIAMVSMDAKTAQNLVVSSIIAASSYTIELIDWVEENKNALIKISIEDGRLQWNVNCNVKEDECVY